MTALSGTQMNAPPSAIPVRIDWVDHMKGVGIVLVVVGHATEGLASHVIYLFYMPLFFVLSGFTFKAAPVAEVFRKRLRGLLVPYVSFLLTLVVLDNLLGAILGTEVLFDLHQPAELLARLVLGGNMLVGSAGAMWFLTTLFLTMLVYTMAIRACGGQVFSWKMIVLVVVALILGRVSALIVPLDFVPFLPFGLAQTPLAFAFFWLGHAARSAGVTDRPAWMLLMMAVGLVVVPFAPNLDIKYLSVGPLLLMLPAAIGLICVCYGGVRLHFLIIVHASDFLPEGGGHRPGLGSASGGNDIDAARRNYPEDLPWPERLTSYCPDA